MAALRLFARSKLSTFLRVPTIVQPANSTGLILNQINKRCLSSDSKDFPGDPSKYTDFEISKDPKEWEYVTRLLRPTSIPSPPDSTGPLPSGWMPPTSKPHDHPYYIQRTRNHMIPVYLRSYFRGDRRITHIRKIQGDIWALHADLKKLIKESANKDAGFRVNELVGDIKIRGDYIKLVTRWIKSKGF